MADDPRVDISLSLLSGNDSAAAKDLATQLENISKTFVELQKGLTTYGQTLQDVSEKMSKLVGETSSAQASGRERLQQAQPVAQAQPTSRSIPGTPTAVPKEPTLPTEETKQTATAKLGQEQQTAAPSEPDNQSDSRQTQSGLLGKLKTVVPSPVQNTLGAIRQGVMGFGQKLGLGSSTNRDVGDATEEETGGGGGLMSKLKGQLGSNKFVGRALETGIGFSAADLIAHPFQSLSNLTGGATPNQVASDLGYQRGGFVGIGGDNGIGLQIPGYSLLGSSTAAQESRQELGTFAKLAVRPGIGPSRARDIVSQTRVSGFSGQAGQNVEEQIMGPLVQQFGMAPSVISLFLGQLRTGAASFKDVTAQLTDLGTSAKASSMNVSQFAEDTAGLMQTLRSIGAPDATAAQLSSQFAQGTGLAPTAIQSIISNPLTQGFLTGESGIPPQALGALPASALMQGSTDAVNTMMQIMGGALQNRTYTTSDPLTGAKFKYNVSGKDQAKSTIASMFGITPAEVTRIQQDTETETLSEIVGSKGTMDQVGWNNIQKIGKAGGITNDILKQATGGQIKSWADLSHMNQQKQQTVLQNALSKYQNEQAGQPNQTNVNVQVGFQPGAAQQLLKVTQQTQTSSDRTRAALSSANQEANTGAGTKKLSGPATWQGI